MSSSNIGSSSNNMVQASLEANRVKQLQKSEFQNIQGHIWVKKNEEDERNKSRVKESEKMEHKRVEKDETQEKDEKQQGKKKGKKGRGGILDIKA